MIFDTLLQHPLLGKVAFSASVRGRTWKKLAAQMHHGLPLDQCLRHLKHRAITRHSPLAGVYDTILSRQNTGHTLNTSLMGFVPQEEIMLIAGGQASGNLAEGFRLAAGLIDARKKIIGAVINALTYPLFLFCLSIGLLLVVSLEAVPQFALISDPATWEGAAWGLYVVASFVASPGGTIVLTLFVATIVCSVFTMPFFTGKSRLYVESLPPWSMYRLTVGAVWLFTLSTLMKSGRQLVQILKEMQTSGNLSPYLRERVVAVAKESGLGKNLGEALTDCGLRFPDEELVDDLKTYAELPGFEKRLFILADEWMTEGIERIQAQAHILNMVCIVSIGFLIIGVVFGWSEIQQQLTRM